MKKMLKRLCMGFLALATVVTALPTTPVQAESIGENKLRRLAEENKNANWLIMNGNRIQVKRKQFEKIIDTLNAI